jgi:hypothetical protein
MEKGNHGCGSVSTQLGLPFLILCEESSKIRTVLSTEYPLRSAQKNPGGVSDAQMGEVLFQSSQNAVLSAINAYQAAIDDAMTTHIVKMS